MKKIKEEGARRSRRRRWACAVGLCMLLTGAARAQNLEQNFETWPNTATFTNTTFDGWYLEYGRVIVNNFFYPAHTGNGAGWLGTLNDSGGNTWLQTPVRPNGAGTISFWTRLSKAGTVGIAVEVSTNGIDNWSVQASFLLSSTLGSPPWEQKRVPLMRNDSHYVRIRRTTDSGSSADPFVGLDDIVMTPPPAMVEIYDVMTHPGYPSLNDAVNLSCRIRPAVPSTLIFGLAAKLYYRNSQNSAYSGPITMNATGDRFYTQSTIPKAAARSRMQFYIEATFFGFYASADENQSPSFYPQGTIAFKPTGYWAPPTNAPAFYDVRPYYSSYDYLAITSSVGVFAMGLVKDNYWQGVIDIATPTNEVACQVLGFGQYTNGANRYATVPTSWGDNDQARLTLPVSDSGNPNGSPIRIQLDAGYVGQVLLRYNSANNSYLATQAAFQHFNDWRASDTYYEASLGQQSIAIVETNFNDWVPTAPAAQGDDFESVLWQTSGTNYSNVAINGGEGWFIQNAYIAQEIDGNQSARLSPETAGGGLGFVWPHRDSLTDGTKSFRFRYRATLEDNHLTYYSPGTNWLGYYVQATVAASDFSPDLRASPRDVPFVSLYTRLIPDGDDYRFYEFRVSRRPDSQSRMWREIWRHTASGSSLLTGPSDLGWIYGSQRTLKFYAVPHNNGAVYLEGWVDQFSISVFDSNAARITGPGTIGFLANKTDIVIDDVSARQTDIQRMEQWSTPASYGTYANNGWTIVNGYQSGNYCRLRERIETSGPTQNFDAWTQANWGTYTNNNWVLNQARSYTTLGYQSNPNAAWLANYDGQYTDSYLRTPLMPQGIGYLRFVAKNSGGLASIQFKVEKSVNGTTWTTVATLTSTSTGAWVPFAVSIYDDDTRYARIIKTQSTADGQWLGLDDVSVSYWSTPASITSPMLTYAPGSFLFNYYIWNSGANKSEVAVDATTDGTNWVRVAPTFSNNPGGWYNNYSVPGPLTSYRQFRVMSMSTNQALPVDEFRITASTNLYSQDFETASLPGWVDPDQRWYIQSGKYRRRGYAGPLVQFEVQTHPTNSFFMSQFYPEVTSPEWQTVATGTASNLNHAVFSVDLEDWRTRFVRIRHTGGAGSLVVDDVAVDSWHGQSVNRNGWVANESWTELRATDNLAIQLYRKRADPSKPQMVSTPFLTNGVGSLKFEYKVVNPPAQLEIWRSMNSTSLYEKIDEVTLSNTGWTSHQMTLNRNSPLDAYLQLRHVTSNTTTTLYLDTIEVSDYAERDETMWYAYNALVTYTDTTRAFEPNADPPDSVRTLYLNNSPSSGVKPGSYYADDQPYVQSPRLPRGIGEISFWYRCYNATGAPPSTIRIAAAPTDTTPLAQWTNLAVIVGITNTAYAYFSTNFYVTDQHFVRIYSTNAAASSRVCLDDLTISEPVGSDLEIIRVSTLPEIPENTNSVRFTAELSNFLLDPTNIQVGVYYYIGEDPWGSWPSTNYTPMVLVSNANYVQYYETPASNAIPPQAVDAVVQYYVAASFSGLFSEIASPRETRQFTPPAWHYPVDLNSGMTHTNPYYIVFSCQPGAVWINEVNYYSATAMDDPANEYVELCGRAGKSIKGWKIEFVHGNAENAEPFETYATYTFGALSSLPNQTNGFGFWTIGDADVPHDVLLTNVQQSMAHIHPPTGGIGNGIRLVRSMGAYEDAVAYGSPMTGFTYIGEKDPTLFAEPAPLFLSGTGLTANAFEWTYLTEADLFTPGDVNPAQELIYVEYNPPPLEISLEIDKFWVTPSQCWLVYTSGTTSDVNPVVKYAPSLTSQWTAVGSATYTFNQGVYTQWFNRQTSSPVYFYKVTADDAP